MNGSMVPPLAVQAVFDDAVRHHQAGRLDETVACFRMAAGLRRDLPETHYNLGTALREQGALDEAVACLHRALDLRPDYPEALNNLGMALKDLGDLDEAVVCYRSALSFMPDYPVVLNNLGAALQQQGRLDEAVASCRRALALRPGFPAALNNLGSALRGQGRLDEAVACYRSALTLKPNYPEAHSNLGAALQEQGELAGAAGCYRRAIALRPDYPEALNNLGTALQEQGELDGAADCCRRAIALRPDFAEAHFSLAQELLAAGNMAEGWEEYEWRWKVPQSLHDRRNFAQPQWRGGAAAGRTLLIHAEQGFGDTLQFCRYAPLAAARGLRVIMEVQKPLVRLLRGLPGTDLMVGRGEELPEFDLHCPMLSLPLALGATLASIPSGSYLRADAAQAAFWQTRLAATANRGRRIGLAWAGNGALPTDRRRSLPPARLAPLFGLSGLRFFSLQKEGPAAPAEFPLTYFMCEMGDFADTAALITNLDLVISVDTAVAHLAAALGKPVWLLDRFDACWRWLTGRRDSPWYPTLRIYRQPHPGDWDSVLTEVTRDLRDLSPSVQSE